MRRTALPVILLALALTTLMGCGESALARATRTANAVRAAGVAASAVLETECVEGVRRAKTPSELAAVTGPCDALRDAYRVERLSHAALLAAIAAGESSSDPLLLTKRVLEAAQAAERVGEAAAAVRDR